MNLFLGVCAGVVVSVMLLVLFNWIEMKRESVEDETRHPNRCDCGQCHMRAMKEGKWRS